MKTIPMLPFLRTCLHLQTCTHSKTTLTITHLNSMVPLLNYGLPPPPYLMPQQSLSAIPPPARFLKKLLKTLPKRMPISAGVFDELIAQVSALVQQSKYTVIEPITQSTSPSSPPANTTVNPPPNVTPTTPLPSLPPDQVQAIIKQQLYYPQSNLHESANPQEQLKY